MAVARRMREVKNASRAVLRAGGHRPRRRTAEQRDEVAASDESCHLIKPAGRARKDSTLVGPCPGFTSHRKAINPAGGPVGASVEQRRPPAALFSEGCGGKSCLVALGPRIGPLPRFPWRGGRPFIQSVDQRMGLGMRCPLSPTADVPSHSSGAT